MWDVDTIVRMNAPRQPTRDFYADILTVLESLESCSLDSAKDRRRVAKRLASKL